MASFELEYDSLAQLPAALHAFAAASPDTVDEGMVRWGQDTRAALERHGYPPAPPPKKGRRPYRRTGQLAHRWAAKRLGRGVIAITNQAQARGRRYATYVIGDPETGRQAWMHRGRWFIARYEIEERGLSALQQRVERALLEAWQRQGLG